MAGPRKSQNGARDDYYDTKDNKMMSSIVGFLENYSGQRQAGMGSRWGTTNFHAQGMMSPMQAPDMVVNSIRRNRANTGFSPQYGIQSSHKIQSSTLLDRHHQPTASHARALRQSVYQHTGYNRGTASLREAEDEDEDEDETAINGHYVSNLGDSFVSTKLDNEQSGPPLPAKDYEGGGVMDLLLQFQRAHADTHGRGIQI